METSGLEGFHRARGRFEEWLGTHSPADLEALSPPADPRRIAEVEEAYGVALHPQLKELLLAHDGAREAHTPSDPGVFLPGGHRLCSCEEAVAARCVLMRLGDEWEETSRDWPEPFGQGPLEAHLDHWVPFARRDDGGVAVVDHWPGLNHGRIYQIGPGPGYEPRYWAADLADLFDQLTDALRYGLDFLDHTPPPADGTARLLRW